MRRSKRPRPSGSPTSTARLRGRAGLPGLGGSRRCTWENARQSEVMQTRSPPQPFGRGVVVNSIYSGKRPPGRTVALHYLDGIVGFRHQTLVCQRYAVLSLVVRTWLLLWVCLVYVERLAVWRCRRPRRNGISTATHRRSTCSDCKHRHRYSFGLSGSRSLCRSFRSGSARSACSLFDS